MKKIIASVLALLASAALALGQTGPANNVPAYKGPGITGFNAIAPVDGYSLQGNTSGAPSFRGYLRTATGAVTRTWQGKADDSISVKDFGALGNSNGTTGNGNNDTSAIQAAVNFASSIGATLYFPCGTYRFTTSIGGNDPTRQYIVDGAGRTCVKLYLDSLSNLPVLSFPLTGLCFADKIPCVQVRNLSIIAPTTATTASNIAIALTNASGATIEGVHVTGTYLGIQAFASYAPKIIGNNLTLVKSIALYSPDSSFNAGLIAGNSFFGNGITSSDAAVNIAASNGGLVVTNNNSDSNFAAWIFGATHEGVDFSSNYMENNTSFDAYWNGTANAWNISGNRFGSGLTTAWENLTNSQVVGNVCGGPAGTLSFGASSTGNWAEQNVSQGGATCAFVPTPRTVGQGGTGRATLTASAPLFGNGTSPVTLGTRSGNTTAVVTTTGTLTSGRCAEWDASGNLIQAAAGCASGGGTPGGSTTQLQYNNAGSFGGITNATTNGTVVTLTSAVLVTPVLGTPSSGVLTNATGLPLSTGVTGNLPVGNLNSGTLASGTTFWRGDGTWATPPGGTGSKSIVSFNTPNLGGLSTIYVSWGGATASAAIADNNSPIPTGGTLARMYVRVDAGTPVVTIMLNGVATSITCTVVAGACNDNVNTATIAAGDLVSARGTSATSSTSIRISAEYTIP